MLGSSTTGYQGAGPQSAELSVDRRRILCPLPNSVRVARRPRWPIPFTVLLLFITTAASKEDQSFLNSVSATGGPTGNATTEKPTHLGHTQQNRDLPFSRLINQTGVSQRNASQLHTSLPQPLDAFSGERKETSRRSYSTSASVSSVGTSLQDVVSSTGKESLGSLEGRSVFLPSSSEGTTQSSGASKFFRSSSSNFPGPTSMPSHVASSRKTLFDQTAGYTEEYDTAGLDGTNPPADVTIPVTQPLFSLWVSARHPTETTTHGVMSTLETLTRLQSEETTEVSTQQHVEPLSLSWFSHGPVPRRMEPQEVIPPSTAMARSHLDPGNSTAIHPYEESVTPSPPIRSLVALVGSSTQPSTADSILQGSQQLGDSFTTPLTSSSPTGSSTVEAEFSLNATKDGSEWMVPGSTGTIPTSVAETPSRQVSLGVTEIAFATATVGLPKEPNPSLEAPSSLLKEHIESFPTTPSFGTSKVDEVPLVPHNILNSSLVEAIKLEPKENTSSIVEGLVGPTVSSIDEPISKDGTDATSVSVAFLSLDTTQTDSAVTSLPYLDIGDVLHPIGATSTRLTYTDLLEGHTTSALSLGSPSVERKLPRPSQSHPTVSPPGLVEFDRSSVTPSHHSLSSSMTPIPFSRISVPETTSKTFINITEGHLVRIRQMMPRSTKSFSATSLSLESRNTEGGIALSLPTNVPRVGLSTSSEMATLENALGHQVAGTSIANNIQTIGRSTLPIDSSRFTTSSNSEVPAYPSSVLDTKSNQGTPILPASATLWTTERTLPVEPTTTCRNSSCPASLFTPPRNRSAQSRTPQPFLARRFLSTISLSMAPKENATLADARGSRSEERDPTTLPRTQMVTGLQQDGSSQQPRSKLTTSPLNYWSVKENWTVGRFASTVPSVRVLSLWFRLIKINYTNSLMNRSSERYKKLEKELKLTLKKMLSTYESFLHAKVLRFLKGSVVVESQVVFQATGLLPTPSDIIRTIVTEVKTRKIDAFFDWKIDLGSLRSNGFSLQNLEPTKLAVFFRLLDLGSTSAFDDKNFAQEHLESLKIKMKLLLGTRYAVHLISLADNRNTQGGIDINGNIFIKTDIHVDISWTLKALIGLSNVSVDLLSLSINGSKLSLQVFPVSFMITNRIFTERMLDRSSVESQNIAKDLSDTLSRILGKYENLLQVTIRKITIGPLVCYGDVIFQQPAPSNKDVLRTLAFAVDPNNFLDSSNFQVDRFSFNVAGAGLEPSLKKPGVPPYAVVLIVIFLIAVIAVPTFLWLPKALARRGKITIHGGSEAGVAMEAFELDNPGYQTTIEEGKAKDSCIGH